MKLVCIDDNHGGKLMVTAASEFPPDITISCKMKNKLGWGWVADVDGSRVPSTTFVSKEDGVVGTLHPSNFHTPNSSTLGKHDS